MENFEVWKPVDGFEGLYEISNLGRVKSIKRKGCNGSILSNHKNNWGYEYVFLTKECICKPYLVHRLVAFAFPEICGEYFEDAEIDHTNTIITDNRAINLKWVTHKRNMNNPLTKEKLLIKKQLLFRL